MSQWMGTGALALWIDVTPGLEDEADTWYVDEHLPDRVYTAGYGRARRYKAVEGGPKYLSIFEAQTPDALGSEGYLALVRQISEQSRRIRAGFTRVLRNTFSVPWSQGRGVGGCMASVRLRATGDAGAAASTGQPPQAMLAAILKQPGIVGVHWLVPAPEVRARMDQVRAVGQGDELAGHALLIEATQPGDIARLRQAQLSAAAFSAEGWREEGFAVYQLLYEVSQNSPGGTST